MSDFNETLAPPPEGAASQEDRTIALLTHLSGVVLSFIVPLIVWLIHRDKPDRTFLTDQSKEALNFQITIAIAFLACSVLTLILIGMLLMPLVWLVNLIFCILAGIKANEGVAYRYPFTLRLIK
ncbi:MAG TPA: DUF4870 domain-containing protein [Luteimonas sp.]|nr:DUF4870 domain-containing protein [Luteimonas sp.]